jgi:glycosyltransferase involved in cell wall biosynthesis
MGRKIPVRCGHSESPDVEYGSGYVLVDGGSTDDTIEVARDLIPDVKVLQQTRRGKGNALVCGMHAATGDIVVTLDADGSADPCEIPAFVEALVDGADFALRGRYTT